MRERILEVVRKWKHYWMNQTHHSEADRKNYFDRAFGIDANMAHHLADMISKDFVEVYVPPTLFLKDLGEIKVIPESYSTRGYSIILVTPETFQNLFDKGMIDENGKLKI